ncbi:MAG: HDIG domain-containing metalloprotein [Planctomycetota bacterium]
MDPEHAFAVLQAHATPGENWPLHSHQVARVALALVRALGDSGHPVDGPAIYVQALLHDIGRSRSHGPLHGWTGFTLLRSMGYPRAGRGCLTHWIKGRAPEELLAAGGFGPSFVARIFAELEPGWSLADSVISVADSSVMHSTIVPLAERHSDLLQRYENSAWLRRAVELGESQAGEIGRLVGTPVETILTPLFGSRLETLPNAPLPIPT